MKALDAYIQNGTKDSRKDSDYDSKELASGIEIEKEHTDCPIKAKMIAKDHLDEIEDYYTRLIKMEENAKYYDDEDDKDEDDDKYDDDEHDKDDDDDDDDDKMNFDDDLLFDDDDYLMN